MGENTKAGSPAGLGLRLRGATMRVAAASFVGWAFLWMYLRESLYFPQLIHLPLGGCEPRVFFVFAVTVAVMSSALSLGGASRRTWAASGPAVCSAGIIGTLGLSGLLMGTPSAETPGAAIFCLLCYLAYAASFAVLFLAWVYEARRQAFTLGIEMEVVLQFAAVFASYILTDDVDGFNWRVPLHALGLAVAGVAFLAVWLQRRRLALGDIASGTVEDGEIRSALGECDARAANTAAVGVGRAEQGAPVHAGTSGDGVGAANARAGARLVPWFALLGISLAATGMLAYSWLFYDRGYAETGTDLLVDVFTFAIMGAMAAFALYMARRPDSRSRMTLELLFVVVLASLVAFFAITVTLTLADGHLYGLARIIKRIARVATFITVLVLVYQCDLDPAKPFVLAFLVPSILPRALQMALAATPWGQGLAGQGGNLMAILLATGFFLVMCLVVFCMLNMDGGLARGILREGGLGQEGQPGMGEGVQATSEARQSFEVACEDLARERALTRREREVMRMYAEGASAQEVALAFSVSVGTVNTHARTLYRKLDIHSKQELADLVAARVRSAK